MYRDQRRSTELSSIVPSPPGEGAIGTEELKHIAFARRSHRFDTAQNPEDVVASRYLQRLGNTLVRRASPDVVEKVAGIGRTSSFKSRRAGSRQASAAAASFAAPPAAPLAASPTLPLPSQNLQYPRSEDGAAATRRWRSQVVAPTDVLTGAAAAAPLPTLSSTDLVGSSVAKTANSATRGMSPVSAALDPPRGSPHDSNLSGKPPARCSEGGDDGRPTRRGASPNTPVTPRKSTNGKLRGALIDSSTDPAEARDVNFSISSGRRADGVRTPGRGIRAPLESQRPSTPVQPGHGGATSTYNEAALRANAAVSQAAALVSTSIPAPRKVRTDEERSAIVLAQEHAKLMLLVGRRANLESDIEDALELAEAYSKEQTHAHVSATSGAAGTTSASTSPQTSSIAPTSSSNARAHRRRYSSTASMADADAQLSIEAGAVRRRMRQLFTNLLGNGVLGSAGGGTTLDSASLARLVQQLQSQLDLVEDDLMDRLEEDEAELEGSEGSITTAVFDTNRHVRAVSTTSSVGAAAAATQTLPPALALLQKRKRALEKQQADLRDAPSNQEHMKWLMESVDAELLTDMPAEKAVLSQERSPSSRPLFFSVPNNGNNNNCDYDSSAEAERKSILQSPRHKHNTSTATTTSAAAAARTAASSSPAEGEHGLTTVLSFTPPSTQRDAAGESDLASWCTHTVSQPSMVPFSLTDSGPEDGNAALCSKGKPDRPKNESAAYGLNLLGFMAEVLGQYELDLEGEATKTSRKKRPVTAPSKNALFHSRTVRFRGDLGGSHNVSDDDDNGCDEEGADGKEPGDVGDSEHRDISRSSLLEEFGLVSTHCPPSPSRLQIGRLSGSGVARGGAGKRQPLFTDGNSASSATGALGANASAEGKSATTFLGAELRNLRVGLLQDLHELRTLFDYMHLIDERRRELTGSVAEKGENDYEAEVERKLAEHRQQQEAMERARNEEQLRKTEGAGLDAFGQTGSRGAVGGQPVQSKERLFEPALRSSEKATVSKPPPRQEAVAPPTGEAFNPSPVEAVAPVAERTDPLAVPPPPAAAAVVETELTRECIADGKLYFVLVGFSSPLSGSAAGTAEDGDRPGSARRKKGRIGSAGGTVGSYLRYELRVERLDTARKASDETGDVAVAAAPLIAVVKINLRRLLNLQLTPADDVSLVSKDKTSVVTAAVERGAAPRPLLSLVPVKRYKASSFAKAFEFSAAAREAGTQQPDNGNNNDSRANSVASMPFTVPSPGDMNSCSASLDSAAVLAAAKESSAHGNKSLTEPPVTPAALAAQEGEVRINGPVTTAAAEKEKPHPKKGKNMSKKDKNAAAPKSTKSKQPPRKEQEATLAHSEQKCEAGVLPSPTTSAEPTGQETATTTMLSVSLPPIKNEKASTSVASAPPSPSPPPPTSQVAASATELVNTSRVHPDTVTTRTPSLSAQQLPLPSTPPLQEVPRPVEEWGVPHPHPEMEAVEKNAVVLTVLWAQEEETPWTVPSPPKRSGSVSAATLHTSNEMKAGDGDTTTSPAAALLATIPADDDMRRDSVTAHRPASGGVAGGEDGAPSKENERRSTHTSSATATAASIDAVASELIRQVMEEDDEAENVEDVAAREEVGEEVQLGVSSTADGVTAAPVPSEEEELTEELHHDIADEHEHEHPQEQEGVEADASFTKAPWSPSTPPTSTGAAGTTPSTSTPQLAAEKRVPPTTTAAVAVAVAPPRAEAYKPEALSSKSAEPPKTMVGTKVAPSLTITSSQSRPMRAEEAHQYAGGPFRLDVAAEEADTLRSIEPFRGAAAAAAAADGTTPVHSPGPRHAPGVASSADPQHHRRLSLPLSATSPVHNTPGSTSSRDQHPPLVPVDGSTSLLPPVVVKQTSGSGKAQVLLPKEAVTSALGPRVTSSAVLKEGVLPSRPYEEPKHHASTQNTVKNAMPATTPATEVSATEDFSVLPKTGAAAEAAADARTVTHVQTFLRAVMRHPKGEGGMGSTGGRFGTAGTTGFAEHDDTAFRRKSSAARGMGALRSEVSQLQEEARQLFLLDPVRYDAVITELMLCATQDLQRDLALEQRNGADVNSSAHEPKQGPDNAVSGLPPVVVVSSSQRQQDQTAVGSRLTLKQVSGSNPLHYGGAEDRAGARANACMSPASLSSVIPHRNTPGNQGVTQHNVAGSGGSCRSSNASAVLDGFSGSVSSQPGHLFPLTSSGREGRASFSSLPPASAGGRRSTHALVMQSSNAHSKLKSPIAAQRKSCADAVAEVERILYEQMKAKLLLRAIIEKMRSLWQAKQRSVEDRNRSRAEERMRKVVNKTLAASWPIEQQRVINLRKLIYLLDRRVGRVHGWLPHYSDTNVLVTATSSTRAKGGLSCTGPAKNSIRTFVSLSSLYRGKDGRATAAAASFAAPDCGGISDDDSADGTCADACPRYLHYLPQRRIYHYMRLAKSRRLMPLQLVRTDVQMCHSRHILLGYEKISLEAEEQEPLTGPVHTGWPKRSLPLHARLAKQRRVPFVPDQHADMRTRGEQERYRRRLQGTAAFQGVSKRFSPRTRQDADLPYSVH